MKELEKQSILYFDDEQSCLDVFKACFGSEFVVHAVSTLEDARIALSKGRFDIVISDQLMPEIDGLTFLRKVAATHPECFRVMLTGSIGVGAVIREVSAGIIHHFVTKPWTHAEMKQALERGSMSWVPQQNAAYSVMRYHRSRNAA